MNNLISIGIEASPHFPNAAYTTAFEKAQLQFSSISGWDDFVYAWNGLAHRFHGATDTGQKIITSIEQELASKTLLLRHQEDQLLFYFFSNCYSCLECFYYAAFAIADFKGVKLDFSSPKIKREINIKKTIDIYEQHFSSAQFTTVLRQVTDQLASGSANYTNLQQIRNTLSHRSQPGRTFSSGDQANYPMKWHQFEISLDAKLISEQVDFLSLAMTKLLSEAISFI